MPYDCSGHQPTIGTYLNWLRTTYGIYFNQKAERAGDGGTYEAYRVSHNGADVVITGLSQNEWLDPWLIAQYDRRLGT